MSAIVSAALANRYASPTGLLRPAWKDPDGQVEAPGNLGKQPSEKLFPGGPVRCGRGHGSNARCEMAVHIIATA